MINIQDVVPGMWFYNANEGFKKNMYVAHVNADTVQLKYQRENNSDSDHTLYSNLQGIQLSMENLDKLGFIPFGEEMYYMSKIIYKEVKHLEADGTTRIIKQNTYLIIDMIEGDKRLNIFLSNGTNKIYLSEISFVHELQLLIYSLTFTFPFIKL